MSEEEYENLIEQYSNIVDELHDKLIEQDVEIENLQSQINQHKQQLAEKDKEIERLKNVRNSTSEQVKNWKHEFAISELEKQKKEESINIQK